MVECSCYRCMLAAVRAKPAPAHELVLGTDPRMIRMFLCATCGNKRCPHAADHRLTCSHSNEPGQAGSLYENVPIFPSESNADDGAPTRHSSLPPADPLDHLSGEGSRESGK